MTNYAEIEAVGRQNWQNPVAQTPCSAAVGELPVWVGLGPEGLQPDDLSGGASCVNWPQRSRKKYLTEFAEWQSGNQYRGGLVAGGRVPRESTLLLCDGCSAVLGRCYQQHHLVGNLSVLHNVNAGHLGRWSLAKSLWSLIWPQEIKTAAQALNQVGLWKKTLRPYRSPVGGAAAAGGPGQGAAARPAGDSGR